MKCVQHFSRTPTAKYKKKKKKKDLPTYLPYFFGTVTGNKQNFFFRPKEEAGIA